jgi:SRSO17 transposase
MKNRGQMFTEDKRSVLISTVLFLYIKSMEGIHAREIETHSSNSSVFSAARWGLPTEAVKDLGCRLHGIWQRYHPCFTTLRHDTSEYALIYLKGLLLLPDKRNYKNIARSVESPKSDGQNLQHFMSDSPWSAVPAFDQIQADIGQDHRLHGGMLTLDESGDVRSGDKSAGAARQHIGNLGKIEMGQVGVALGYYAANVWTMVAAELFLPKVWFDDEHKKRHRRLHIPEDRVFRTKLAIGLSEIDRAQANGLPFTRFSCDSLYGRSHAFRADIDRRKILYLADIPCNLKVYRQEPVTGIPPKPEGTRGRRRQRWQILNAVEPMHVRAIAQLPEIVFETIDLRPCERGRLCYDCAATLVWTIAKGGQVRREWLFMRRESDGSMSYALSNAPENTPLSVLTQWRAERYFVERTFQDAKSEGGWDELIAQKYRAWMHHTALDALALWYIAQTKLDWAQAHPRDPKLAEELQLDQLPALSMANLRLLLQAVMPLEQLSVEQAIDLVVTHLVNRSTSTQSRLKTQRKILKEQKRKDSS